MRFFGSGFSGFNFGKGGDPLKTVAIASGAVLLLIILIGTVVFVLSLEGSEQTMVPDVTGKDLADGILDLQENSLVPFVQKRLSSDPALKGTIVSQSPHGGTLVKAGKPIKIFVSMGAIVDRVGSYVGKDINDVRIELQSLFVTSKPLLRIKEPVTYVFSEKPAGTVLEQKPKADTEITDLTDIDLVVSRGPEGEKTIVAQYIGQYYTDAIKSLARDNIPFTFATRKRKAGESSGVIANQTPAAGVEVPRGQTIQLEMTDPPVPKGSVPGVFEYALPDYYVMVDIKLDIISPSGERRTVFSMKHPGGTVSVPYVEPVNSQLKLTVEGRDLITHLVTARAEDGTQPAP